MQKPLTIARWLLVPVAGVAGWFAAFIAGSAAMRAYLRLFDPGDYEERLWVTAGLRAIILMSTASAAALVVAASAFMAPARRVLIAWLAYAIGAVVAIWMVLDTQAWLEFISAMVSGFLTSALLTRRMNRKTPAAAVLK